jgi:oligogalacturonide transporter
MTDVDELITSERRAGTYSGMATFCRKVANGLALGLVGLILGLVGYDGSLAVQTNMAVNGIRVMFVFLPILFIICTMIFVKIYPLNKNAFEVLKTEIDKRKNNDKTTTSEEEKRLLESVTGYPYEKLWSKENGRI